jgi:hypothetical protein
MDEASQGATSGPSHRSIEIGTAIAMIIFGLIVIAGSLQVGIGWGAEGPKSGFFPFYLGVVIIATSAVNLWQAALIPGARLFAGWRELGQVLEVVAPATIYVVVMPWSGIYIASIVLITYFMCRLGRYPLHFSLAIAVGVMVSTYLTFEKWFLVPLPKGPIEDLLGL